ncbi:MAG: NADH-quinone oxidoreductase subunit J [Puniceicoccales bacterium]|jgi:NADH:ubiquinone oxidoreductase subunit 6 (subunit J)|nr:NADH-quinone oxidoreductase subunit J [Puniceicoccales bacterium]
MSEMKDVALVLIALFTVGIAATALSLRNIVHCTLLLTVSWLGVAAFFLWAEVQFVAFAQALVYAGAIAMVVLFAVLLTRRDAPADNAMARKATWLRGLSALSAALLVVLPLFTGILATPFSGRDFPWPEDGAKTLPVREIGHQLLSSAYVLPLLITGVLLTVALLGAMVIAAPARANDGDGKQ